MTSTNYPSEAEQQHALDVAENLLHEALDLLRSLTPDGWRLAYYRAMDHGDWNSLDMAMLDRARVLSIVAGPRFRPAPVGGSQDP